MLILSEADVTACLSMHDAVEAVEAILRAQAAGAVNQPLRVIVRSPAGFLGAMPSAVAGACTGAKLVTFFPGNGVLGIPTHNAIVALFDNDTGVPAAVMDGRYITEIRTAATSAIATRALAAAGPRNVAILGTGVQARSHVEALAAVGPIDALRVWGRTAEHAESMAAWCRAKGHSAKASPSVATATSGATVICTVTPAQSPILDARDVPAGCHVNAVGASAPHMRELSSALVGRATVFVDTVEGGMQESGEIIEAIRDGTLPPKPKLIRLCDVVAGNAPGRTSSSEVTLFKSLGMAIEDLACASLVLARARERGLGTAVAL